MEVTCARCGAANLFDQPYAYHAGFGDSVFLYNDAGNCTLVWGTYDPAYLELAGESNPWNPPTAVQERLERVLPRSPLGDRWTFASPARCGTCGAPIRAPMIDGEIHYLEYPGSIILGRAGLPRALGDYLESRPAT